MQNIKLINKIKFKYNLKKYNFLNYPSFVSHAERISLYKKVKEQNINNEFFVIGEFGPFLGGSTVAMAESLKRKKVNNAEIHVYDSFCMKSDTDFFKQAMRILKDYNYSLKDLNHKENDFFDFENLFHSLTSRYNFIKTHKVKFEKNITLENLDLQNKLFDLVHIDLPKTMDIGIKIMEALEEKCKKNVTLIFQDYAYRWSAEIISYIGLLIQEGALIEKIIGPSIYLYISDSKKIIRSANHIYRKNLKTNIKGNYLALTESISASERYVDDLRKPELYLAKAIYEKKVLNDLNLFIQTLKDLDDFLPQILSKKVVSSIIEIIKDDFTLQRSI